MAPVHDTVDPRVLTVPISRLGRLLGVARDREGISRLEVARRLQWAYGPTTLSLIEGGQVEMPGAEIPTFIRAYAVDVDSLFPDRDGLVVNLRRGRLAVGKRKVKIPKDPTADDVLSAYLAFVRTLRHLPPDRHIEPASLRIDDVVELANALGTHPVEVERRLRELLGHDDGSRAHEPV